MKRIMFFAGLILLMTSSAAPAFIYENREKNDPKCERSMRLVKKKFGNPDEILQLTSNSITTIYRSKRLHFTFEVVGRTCVVTSSDF